jgi:hypothetical protein
LVWWEAEGGGWNYSFYHHCKDDDVVEHFIA